MNAKRRKPLFRVGEHVKVPFGLQKLPAVVVEDRGPIGIRGRRLYQVEIPIDPFEPMRVETSEEDMEAIPQGSETIPVMDRDKVIDYLQYGGILSILRENLRGGPRQPRAWLRPDTLGNVTYTLVPERGVIGGQIVPARALWEGKIARDKRDEVASFLGSFGLSRQEADKVIAEVGTAANGKHR
jgi:hypothetical protein